MRALGIRFGSRPVCLATVVVATVLVWWRVLCFGCFGLRASRFGCFVGLFETFVGIGDRFAMSGGVQVGLANGSAILVVCLLLRLFV